MTRSVVLLCLAAQLSVQLHLVFVEHAACPEHGELVHRSETSQRPAGLRETAPSSPQATLEASVWDAPDLDDHCGLAQLRRDSLDAEIFRAPPAPDAIDLLQPQLSDGQVTPSGRARWALAPKTSPPHV